jgi:glycosyltransferase involved in cell wall biosynthesis
MKISVIVSTYNQPEWLRKVLHGYLSQTFCDFELLIADDGSDDRTAVVVNDFERLARFSIRHIWQEDDGFQKTKILNKAITAADGDYLVFSDGDCIPRKDFLAVHARRAEPGRFLSGGYCKLPYELSVRITADDIRSGLAFELDWLRANGFRGLSRAIRIAVPPNLAPVCDALTPTKATWNGHNASGWKSDILAVNGFNERMQYGGEDREMGERLTNAGIMGRQIRHRAILLHLDHKRGYVTPEMIQKNLAIREQVRISRSVWCPDGILKSPHP